jgi:ribosome maturation factor RimP
LDEVTERVRSLAEVACARNGVDCVDAVVKRGKTTLVRVTVDADAGVDLDRCADVSAALSRLLDADDPLEGRYTLEVTTPGADRPLFSAKDFRRNVGRPIRGGTDAEPIEGAILEVGDDSVTLASAQGTQTVPLASLRGARVVFPW